MFWFFLPRKNHQIKEKLCHSLRDTFILGTKRKNPRQGWDEKSSGKIFFSTLFGSLALNNALRLRLSSAKKFSFNWKNLRLPWWNVYEPTWRELSSRAFIIDYDLFILLGFHIFFAQPRQSKLSKSFAQTSHRITGEVTAHKTHANRWWLLL